MTEPTGDNTTRRRPRIYGQSSRSHNLDENVPRRLPSLSRPAKPDHPLRGDPFNSLIPDAAYHSDAASKEKAQGSRRILSERMEQLHMSALPKKPKHNATYHAAER